MSEFVSDLETFQDFPKIPRISRDCIITEKLDGTNAQVVVLEDGRVLAGSRNRFITPEADNYGFAKWVKQHEDELRTLGPGRHYGEWWGNGINRNYGLKEKRFSLFNVSRWADARPPCCDVVPTLYKGPFYQAAWEYELGRLTEKGSFAAPGFMKPEGIVIFHIHSGYLFKKTIEHDEMPKGMVA